MKKLNLKKLMCSLFLLFLLGTTLVACKSASVVLPTTTNTTRTTTIKVTLRDTTFNVPKDSSYYKAYLECVNGKVVIKENTLPVLKKGKYLQPPKVTLYNNELKVDCATEAQKLFTQWKEKYIVDHKDSIQKIPYPVEQPLSWWQETEIILGRIFLGILGLFSIAVGLRLTKVL